MSVDICFVERVEKDEILDLYRSMHWSSAEKPELLIAALNNSHSLVTASIDGRLIGLCNAISDGYLVVYYPHMIVHPDYQRQGIGRKMMELMKGKYGDFHQQMIVADGGSVEFYKSLGYERAGQTVPLWVYDGHEH